jgi:hypothetical protein
MLVPQKSGSSVPLCRLLKGWMAKAGLLASLRFCFAFFGLDKRYRDFTPTTRRAPGELEVDVNL